jgi:hypothetical protein
VSAARHSSGWKRQAQSAFSERLGLKVSAVALALALWFIVGAREPTEDVAAVRFAPQLDSALVLRDPAPPIRALVVGRPSEILKLANTPLVIRRPITNDVPDTLVVDLRPSDVEVPEGVSVIVRDVQPHAVTLRFETTTTRRVAVQSAIYVPEVGATARLRFDPESVTVLGPRRVLGQLRSVRTIVDTIPFDTLPHLVDLDTTDATGVGLVVRPVQVKAVFNRPRRPVP